MSKKIIATVIILVAIAAIAALAYTLLVSPLTAQLREVERVDAATESVENELAALESELAIEPDQEVPAP